MARSSVSHYYGFSGGETKASRDCEEQALSATTRSISRESKRSFLNGTTLTKCARRMPRYLTVSLRSDFLNGMVDSSVWNQEVEKPEAIVPWSEVEGFSDSFLWKVLLNCFNIPS